MQGSTQKFATPQSFSVMQDKTAFYTHLNSVYSSVPRADIIIVMGDLNAQVGADNYGLERVTIKNGFWSRNENGDMLVDFCNENLLVIGGTVFKHKTCNKVTWVHPDGHTENQIDHIMIQQRWRKSMCDVRNIRNGCPESQIKNSGCIKAIAECRKKSKIQYECFK
ncbi:craniofacial development protein 2-like [Eupeodes corollae]|uniref:craniofacial development protein 2-like n=1 Tax=Eupeodes corollae TaxID=290404 RepID=UPI002493137F|nr:craniofacial development protein 2-like [Eupeodes corollae]